MFEYHSVQFHVEDNKTKIRKVDIKGSKGYKEVTEKSIRGKTVKRSRKPLTKSEIGCIRKCQFVPGLFKSCERCIKNSETRRHRKN